ncbi:cytochrome b [Curvivirga aplysinae]|uniref:cytochrome b n=1 Tax=Curvivirga aplysinae TaxID=2529852 RepID=UPI0012BB4FF9|nr:cytochrome b [Curvivirga aplysinae]MTI10603.1 cytochrome b [Curvivirga aplysinae]
MHWRNQQTHWGMVAILMHFGVAFTVFGLFALGWWMVDLTYYDSWYKPAPHIHKSIGILLFITMILRLAWRIFDKPPEHLDTHAKWEQISAKITHILLYALIFGIIFSGYLISTADGRPIKVFDWFEVPALITSIEKQEDIAGVIHWYAACVLIGLAVLHILGAFKHHVIDKDTTLTRMLGKNRR